MANGVNINFILLCNNKRRKKVISLTCPSERRTNTRARVVVDDESYKAWVYIHRLHDKAKLKAAQQPWHRDGGIRERLAHDVLDGLPDGRREVDAWTWHVAVCDDHESLQWSSTRHWCGASGHPRVINFLHPSFALRHHVIPLCTHIQLWSIIISVLLSPRLLRFLHYTEDRAENFMNWNEATLDLRTRTKKKLLR